MIDAPEIELNSPFDAQAPDEEANLTALTRSLRRANGFGLIFAVCNQSDLRERLMRELAARLPEKDILQIPILQPIDSLLTYVTAELEAGDPETPPDAIFVYGLEWWLPAPGDEAGARFVANLNLFRNNFPKRISCPMVLWVPQHILADIQDRAPDFASVRSGVYVFSMTSESRSQFLNSYTSEELTAIAGLTLEEKLERIARLEHLLKEFQSLPDAQRNLLDEARLMTSLASLYYELARFNDATPLFEAVLRIYREKLPEQHPDIAEGMNNLALLYSTQGRDTDAENLYEKALEIKNSVPFNSKDYAIGMRNLSLLYIKQKRYDEAESLLNQALGLVRAQPSAFPFPAADIANTLADLRRRRGQNKSAERFYGEALRILQSALPPQHPEIAICLHNLANIYIKQGKYKESLPMLKEALQSVKNSYGTEHPTTLLIAEHYAALLALQGQHEQACDLIARLPLLLERIPATMLDQIMQAKEG